MQDFVHQPYDDVAADEESGFWVWVESNAGLLSNQGEKSINFYFIMVPLRKKVLKYGTPKPRMMKMLLLVLAVVTVMIVTQFTLLYKPPETKSRPPALGHLQFLYLYLRLIDLVVSPSLCLPPFRTDP